MELDSHHGPNFIAQADQAAPIGSGCSDNRRSGNPRPIESHWRQFQFGAARLAVDRPGGPGHKEVDSLTDSMRKIGVRRREHSDKPSPSHHILRGFVHGSQWILVPQCDSGRPKRYSSTLVQAPMGLFADALVRPSERLDQRLYTDRRTDRDDPCRWVAAAHGKRAKRGGRTRNRYSGHSNFPHEVGTGVDVHRNGSCRSGARPWLHLAVRSSWAADERSSEAGAQIWQLLNHDNRFQSACGHH